MNQRCRNQWARGAGAVAQNVASCDVSTLAMTDIFFEDAVVAACALSPLSLHRAAML